MKRIFILAVLCFGSLSYLRAEESPPFEVKDPAATENFRNIYLAVDTLVSSITTNSANYLQTSSATATYLQLSSATATYLQKSSATATYLQLSSAAANYIRNIDTLQPGTTFYVSSGTAQSLNATQSTSTRISANLVSPTSISDRTGTVIAININSSGHVLQPVQPCFSAYLETTATDVTGDNTSYTVIPNVENFDVGSNYNAGTGVFTAPVTGKYQLNVRVKMLEVTVVTHTSFQLNLNTSNRNYTYNDSIVAGTSAGYQAVINEIVDMDANDTATVLIQVNGSSKTSDVQGAGAGGPTYFTGSLIN